MFSFRSFSVTSFSSSRLSSASSRSSWSSWIFFSFSRIFCRSSEDSSVVDDWFLLSSSFSSWIDAVWSFTCLRSASIIVSFVATTFSCFAMACCLLSSSASFDSSWRCSASICSFSSSRSRITSPFASELSFSWRLNDERIASSCASLAVEVTRLPLAFTSACSSSSSLVFSFSCCCAAWRS